MYYRYTNPHKLLIKQPQTINQMFFTLIIIFLRSTFIIKLWLCFYCTLINIKNNHLGFQLGGNVSWLKTWVHSNSQGEKLNINTEDIRSPVNGNIVSHD